jgi:predicted transcriptional regulator
MLRRQLDDNGLARFAEELASTYFGVPQQAAGSLQLDDVWLLPPAEREVSANADTQAGRVTLHRLEDGQVLRSFGPVDLERIFHPLRLAISSRRALMVPIQPRWADRLMSYPRAQQLLFPPIVDRLLLRSDNVYYCFPRCHRELEMEAPILFYVSAPHSACVGEARILEYAIDTPANLYSLYGDLGVYTEPDIQAHVQNRGEESGKTLALRFGLYVPFPQAVALDQLNEVFDSGNAAPQGLTPISLQNFMTIRSLGGLLW